jgi:hypothetical protein
MESLLSKEIDQQKLYYPYQNSPRYVVYRLVKNVLSLGMLSCMHANVLMEPGDDLSSPVGVIVESSSTCFAWKSHRIGCLRR